MDAHARLVLAVLLAIEFGLHYHMCDILSIFEEDRLKSEIAIVNERRC